MNAQIVLSWDDFWTGTLMWKNGQNETEHSTYVDAAADWKDRSPMVERIVRGVIELMLKYYIVTRALA